MSVDRLTLPVVTWSDLYPSAKLVSAHLEWSHQYDALAADLGGRLGPDWLIEHVGSTSVPGLAAKPVIDMAIRIPAGVRLTDAVDSFTMAGWTVPRELGDHAASFPLVDGRRAAIAHIFAADQWTEAHVRLFSAWLRAHLVDRDRYGILKTDLVLAGAWEDGRYTAAKGQFVLEIVNCARETMGLPPLTRPL